ncbi:HYR domain-containing protein [Brevibacillus choshinensis]|uniref:HYR domain-containing protein n=1 Tax=Brevibacillus choshinensis TaxID=54911 RepID=A0ABX7FJX7_BRECH|nr:HYR domain-containing protein [Brevibacillus choshinensis]QRG65930.1 HYR domain-containing protein [Brevibacillus choshinensis]
MSGVGTGEGEVIITFETEPPAIICPANITATAEPGNNAANVTYAVAASSPACGIVSISCAPSGETHVFPALPVAIAIETGTFPVGTTVVTCTTTNVAGNTASCSFTVTVTNTVTPTVSPPIPNNLQAECIRVQKVYDWVVAVNRERNKVPIPDDCRSLVDAAIRAGQNITIQCVEPIVPPTFPLIPKRQPTHFLDFSCNVVGIRRENIIVGGNVVRVGIVRFLFDAILLIRVFANGTLLCEFPATIQFDDEISLCLPEPLDETNILCRITAVECNPFDTVLLGGMVELEVIICKEIQVEAEIKMEVLGKFCSPRPASIPVPSPTPSFRCPSFRCPSFVFPPQCPAINSSLSSP